MSAKVSVIVPIYNTEPYIERCVRSLMEQTLNEVEYVFINDYSPDNSITLLKSIICQYPKRIQDIKLIEHDTNKGVFCSKVEGMKSATGEFLAFCDSDDWMDADLLEKAYAQAMEKGSDVVVFDYQREFAENSERYSRNFNDCQATDIVKHGYDNGFEWMLPTFIMRNKREAINRLTVFPEVKLWEDVYISINMFMLLGKASYLSGPCYHYNQTNQNSIVHNIDENRINDCIFIASELDKLLPKSPEFTLERAWLKQFAKQGLLSKGELRKWRDTFKDSNKHLLCMKNWGFCYCFLLLMAAYHITIPFKLSQWLWHKIK